MTWRAMTMVVLGGSVLMVAHAPRAAAADVDDEKAHARADKDYEQGIRYSRAGKAKSAIRSFEKALPFRHDSSDIFFNLVQACEAAERWAKHALYSQGFLYLEPDTDDAKQIARALKGTWRRLASRGKVPVSVVFDLDPEMTTAYVNEVPLSGNRVTEVKLLPGTYRVTADRDGYEPWETSITVVAGQPQTVKGALTKKVYKGKLAIVTTPADGVKVFVDDEYVGTTPLPAPLELATLKYLIRFELAGHDAWSRYVTIKRDEVAELKPVLERTPLEAGQPPPGR